MGTPPPSKSPIYIFLQQIYVQNFLNMLHTLHFFPLQNAVYFIMLPFIGSCIIPILLTGCAKIKMPNSGAKTLNTKSRVKPPKDYTQHLENGESLKSKRFNSFSPKRRILERYVFCPFATSKENTL
jgi:hypothetical protein